MFNIGSTSSPLQYTRAGGSIKVQIKFSGLDLGKIQNIVDEREQRLAAVRISSTGFELFLPNVSLIGQHFAMPMMPFIGVRISWLIDARNSLLARLAASAAS